VFKRRVPVFRNRGTPIEKFINNNMYMSKLFVLHIWHYKTKHLAVYFIKNPFLLNKWKKRIERGILNYVNNKLIDFLLMETLTSIFTDRCSEIKQKEFYIIYTYEDLKNPLSL
jgi:hypothetical protein